MEKKKYRPKPVLINPLGYVLEGKRLLDPDQVLRTKIINHWSMQSLVRGTGTREDWDYVCAALNIAKALGSDQMDAALEAHAQCGKRMFAGGRPGYTGPQMLAVNNALAIHDAQLDVAQVVQMERAHIAVRSMVVNRQAKYKVKELA